MNAVELTDLTKHYGDFTLDRVSLTLPEGCVMGLVGENGAGKTTVIKLLLGMLRRDGGAVRVLGRDMDTDGRAVKEELGVVLDETGFPREGYQLGDLAGAVSLAIPMELYEAEAAQRTAANVGLFVVLAAVIVLCAVTVNVVLSRQGRQIQAMNEKLEETNEHLARVNEALRRESEYKSTFLATMSHELRTPLASTIALVDVWERDAADASEADQALMGEIRRHSASLLGTINNTLDAASLEAGRYRWTSRRLTCWMW